MTTKNKKDIYFLKKGKKNDACSEILALFREI